MEIASNLGYAMVDRMLGGEGEPLEKTREFSEIELLIIERILTVCVNLLHEPWENVVDIHPRLERIETNSQFAQIISPSEMIAIVTINIKIGDVEGLMNVCLPYLTLEDIMDKLNTKYWYSTMQDIIRLDTKVNQELDVFVGNIKKFTALPGSSGDKYAVRITSVIREEQ